MDEKEELEPGTTNDDETAFRCECCRQTFDSDEYYSLETCNDGGLGVVLCGPCCAFADGLLARSTKVGNQHPTQPVQRDEHGTLRFKRNEIVQWLLDEGPFDMNTIAIRRFPAEDRRQFAQLIGYSVSGYQELSYATAVSIECSADEDAEVAGQADDVVAAMYAWADEMEAKPGDVGTFIAAEIRRRVREASNTEAEP